VMLAVVAIGFIFVARRYRYREDSGTPSESADH